MWNRKQLKKLARADVKDNYLHCLIVSLVVVALMGSYGLFHSATVAGTIQKRVPITTNAGILDLFLSNTFGQSFGAVAEYFAIKGSSAGVLAGLVNSVSSTGSFLYGTLNLVNKLVFSNSILPGVIMAAGALIYIFYWAFVQNVITVGQHRFFMENRCYHATSSERLVFVFRLKRTKRVAYTMFLQFVISLLWCITIVGGPIMFYAYRMVPAILAENPDIAPLKVLALSRQMMRGNKWKTFLLDLSFLGWNLLSLFTLRLLNPLFITPYALATNAELYMILREAHLAKNPQNAAYLNDKLLEIPSGQEGRFEYPEDAYPIAHKHSHLTLKYNRKYCFLDIVMLFFTYAIVGYVYEVIYFVLREGVLINRGTLHGPWLPIYGFGGVLSLILLRRFAAKPLHTFFLSMLLCGTIEYATAWFLETFFHAKWWDYTGFFLNIQGRVCAEGLIVFGLGCSLGIYVLAPSLVGFYEKFSKRKRLFATCIVAAAFVGDLGYSAINPNWGGTE